MIRAAIVALAGRKRLAHSLARHPSIGRRRVDFWTLGSPLCFPADVMSIERDRGAANIFLNFVKYVVNRLFVQPIQVVMANVRA
jgi:hypothetical protein